MRLNRKKFLVAGIVIIIAGIAATLIVFRFFPVNKLWNLAKSPGDKYLQGTQVGSYAPNSLFYDFEVDSLKGTPGGLYKGIAHSGKFSAKAFGKNSYSAALEKTAGEIGEAHLSAVSVSAWLYVFPGRNEPLGSFVFSANTPLGANFCWKGIHVEGPEVPRGKWFKISGYFDLSDVQFKPDSKILIYFWNNSSTDILVDDYYVVFGGQSPRRGDSAQVDMTKGITYTPRFNYPPYPFKFLEKKETGNTNSAFIISNSKEKTGDLSPYDRIVTGFFFNGNNLPENIIAVDKAGLLSAYSWCPGSDVFRKVSITAPVGFSRIPEKASILSGSFLPGANSQLLILEDRRLHLWFFERSGDPCKSGAGIQKLLLESEIPVLSPSGEVPVSYYSADLDGDRVNELISVGRDGSYFISRFTRESKGSVSISSVPGHQMIPEWNGSKYDVKISAGKFLVSQARDVLLTVFREKGTKKYGYFLSAYDTSRKIFILCLRSKDSDMGITMGLDTLKPEDEFFSGKFGSKGLMRIFRYNRDWRYDFKEIRFNDSAFQILRNIDFRGYVEDHNPKYFEILRIIPGNYFSSGEISFMLIGKNCKSDKPGRIRCSEFEDHPELPNSLQFYVYPEDRP